MGETMKGEPDLLKLAGALDPPRAGTSALDGGQKQSSEDCDNRYDNQQLDEREAAAPYRHALPKAGRIPSPKCWVFADAVGRAERFSRAVRGNHALRLLE